MAEIANDPFDPRLEDEDRREEREALERRMEQGNPAKRGLNRYASDLGFHFRQASRSARFIECAAPTGAVWDEAMKLRDAADRLSRRARALEDALEAAA